MKRCIQRMWTEDDGVLSFEWILLVTLLTIGIVDPDNHVTIFLPPDLALRVKLRIAKGESRIDLSGQGIAGGSQRHRQGPP